MIGYGFMGKAHSNAWRQAPHFFPLKAKVEMHTICGRDRARVESARGQGVGRALIKSVYERAKAAGSTRVYWQTHETNLIAMKLYDQVAERSGFVVYRKQL